VTRLDRSFNTFWKKKTRRVFMNLSSNSKILLEQLMNKREDELVQTGDKKIMEEIK
jgi:hypothetical protein